MYLYKVRVTEVTTRVLEFRVEAGSHPEAVRLAEYEASKGGLKGDETFGREVSAEFEKATD